MSEDKRKVKLNKRLYSIWRGMLRRCKDKNTTYYKYYGGKGIKVEFKGWHDFRDWANSNGYADNLTIDRIDPEKNYSKENCQWITQSENSRRSAQYHGYHLYTGSKEERKYQQDKVYREKHHEELKQKKHDYYMENRDRISAKSLEYRKNPIVKERKKEYDKNRRKTEEYKAKRKEYNRTYLERKKAKNGAYV